MRELRETWAHCRCTAIVFCLALAIGCGDGNDNAATRAATPTPSATASPAPRPCPARLDLHVDGAGVDLDLGATGIAYDVPLNEGITLPLAAACDGADADCGQCTLTAAAVEAGERSRRRCAGDSRVICNADDECPSGPCIDFFGPPFGVTTGGATSCTRNRLVSVGPGSYEPGSGSLALPIALRWTFFTNPEPERPCPLCGGANLGDPGVCDGGPHDGESCVVDGTDALFGNTSYDCPPHTGGELGSFDLVMTLTTATSTLEPVHTCTAELSAELRCYCDGQVIVNTCSESTCSSGSAPDDVCAAGPVDGFCTRERFRGCLSNADCPAPDDHCAFRPRECLGAADEAAGAVSPIHAMGTIDPEHPVLVAAFCVPAASAAGPNQGLGLPGPAVLRMPVRVETVP